MNIVKFFVQDEFKQQQITKFIVEAALVQFVVSFMMIVFYLFTDIEPLFLLGTPFAVFIFYSLVRYVLSGIEFANVLTDEDYQQMKKRNRLLAVGVAMLMGLLWFLFNQSIIDSVCLSLLTGFLLWLLETISLKKSFKKNQSL